MKKHQRRQNRPARNCHVIFFSQASQRLRLEQFLGICGEDIHIFQMILELSAVVHWCSQLPGRKEWHGLFWFPNHSSIFLTLETPNRKKSHLGITLRQSSTLRPSLLPAGAAPVVQNHPIPTAAKSEIVLVARVARSASNIH